MDREELIRWSEPEQVLLLLDKSSEELKEMLGDEFAVMKDYAQNNPHHCYNLLEHTVRTAAGMDCSGFVDWVFYNATGGEYIIGHGGGASAQHSYCTAITWDEAIPGDLVFYPEDSHVGIVGGRDENGNLLIIHCASGANNVVITGVDGFTSIGRPVYYNKSY